MFISRGKGSSSIINLNLVRSFHIASEWIGGDMELEYYIIFTFDKEHKEIWRYETKREAEEVYRKILTGTYNDTGSLIKL